MDCWLVHVHATVIRGSAVTHDFFHGPYASLNRACSDADRLGDLYAARPYRIDGADCVTVITVETLNAPLRQPLEAVAGS